LVKLLYCTQKIIGSNPIISKNRYKYFKWLEFQFVTLRI
jgi:hypothetical protein